jgi:hypothetical protein
MKLAGHEGTSIVTKPGTRTPSAFPGVGFLGLAIDDRTDDVGLVLRAGNAGPQQVEIGLAGIRGE